MNVSDLTKMSKEKLRETRDQLVIDKMKLDKFFSDYLEENELDHDTTDTEQWVTYKRELTNYKKLTELINWSNYYLTRKIPSVPIKQPRIYS